MGKYASFEELARHEMMGRDYRVHACERPRSHTLIVAPHGGMIEVGTSEIARAIAGDEHNLFLFEGAKPLGANRDLHITSHRFDHPDCLAMAARCQQVLSVHGCLGERRIHLGGLDATLAGALAEELSRVGFPVEPQSRKYPGRHPLNICNRGARARGAQLEVTYDLRINEGDTIAAAVRTVLAATRSANVAVG